jgi:hypothetical protein
MSSKDIVIAAAGGGQIISPIAYVGGKTVSITPSTSSNTTISLTNLTGSPDPTLLPGDVVIVSYVIGTDDDASNPDPKVTSPNNYTQITDLFANGGLNSSSDTFLYSAYKVMGTPPDTSVEVSPTRNTGQGGVVAIQAFRYVDEVYPLQAPANTAVFVNTVRPTPPTITPWDPNAVAVIIGAGAHTRGNVAYATTGLLSFISSGSTNVADDASIGAGFRVIPTGSYSPNQFGFPQTDSGSFTSAALSVALKTKPDTVIPSFISYRSGTTSGTSLTLTAPTGIQVGDLLLLFIGDNTGTPPTFTPPSEFSLSATIENAIYDVQSYIYKKIATVTEPASYTITKSTSLGNFSAMLVVLRNANTINTVGTPTFQTTRTPTAVTLTPTRGGMLLSYFVNVGSKTVVAPLPNVTLLGTAGSTPGTAMYYTTGGPYVPTANQKLAWTGAVGTQNQTLSYQLQITQE